MLGSSDSLQILSESDSTTAVAWAVGKGHIPWAAFRDIRLLHQLTAPLKEWKISHVYREGNRVADCLAAAQSEIGVSYLQPSQLGNDIKELIWHDKHGTIHLRSS
ncbi:hypothetical protein QJS04_geneDACA017203 [Acorus gramineus]|uniref:RNase H type-1 domain-containing protein n=1 Tax=Acorus gramineus TaxID=55184 RepID=A0AAV9BRR8_ACOGR|nr:hypothetical protein QJS04_geneDACA017203 [Acorus gramineus]